MFLYDESVGELREGDHGVIEFRLDPDYRARSPRRVLGQWFEDRPKTLQQHGERPGVLPPFFANLIPEGDLGLLLRDRLGVEVHDDLGLLAATGRDLPGALEVRWVDAESASVVVAPSTTVTDERDAFRFSLAGVQLKFSMVRRADRFLLPGSDERGEWIVKIAREPTGLVENEFVTMEWARRAGFAVPKCELRKISDLIDVPVEEEAAMPVFVIERYDRDGQRRIHQEDFQQIVGRDPDGKYKDVHYGAIAILAARICGEQAFDEVMRRLVFMVASGNNDAHMKNWSILYPDGIHAELTPLYDQVFTAQWPAFAKGLHLKLGGTLDYGAIDGRRFGEIARRAGRDPGVTEKMVGEMVTRIADAWSKARDETPVLPEYREALRRHWARVPILKAHALLL